jgi:hypothetical protein
LIHQASSALGASSGSYLKPYSRRALPEGMLPEEFQGLPWSEKVKLE